jgi:YHS domain-containing protein
MEVFMFLYKKIIGITVAFGIGAFSLSAQTAASTKTDTAVHHMKMAGSDDSVMTVKDQNANNSDSSKTKPKLAPQTTCPVMGGPVNKKVYADYKGKRVYFCCGGCIATFKKDPEKYIKELEASGQSVEKITVDNSSKK